MRRLLILAESQRRNQSQGPIPALELYAGVYFRVLKKYLREGRLENVDVLILTGESGLVPPDKPLRYREPFPGPAVSRIDLDQAGIERLRVKNLRYLRNLFKKGKYEEIYVNVGQQFLQLLGGIESLGVRITLAKGSGLGPKARDMKEWILNLPK